VSQSTPAVRPGRRIAGRAQEDPILDPYRGRQKLREPTVCPQCSAVYRHGRWQWGRKPDDAGEVVCPACRRINDGSPAGSVTLHGAFAGQQQVEIVGLIRNEEAAEKGEHPLNRVIGIAEADAGLVVFTTDIHLPRRLGAALKRAFHGELEVRFEDAEYFVRVDWTPPASCNTH
jgi:hypothetical protein